MIISYWVSKECECGKPKKSLTAMCIECHKIYMRKLKIQKVKENIEKRDQF